MSRRSGFTLIEVLLVLVSLAVLISVLLPALASDREEQNRRICKNNNKMLMLSLILYRDAHGRNINFPAYDGSAFLTHLYVSGMNTQADQYLCPSSGDNHDGITFANTGNTDAMTSYAGRRNSKQAMYPGLYTTKGASETSVVSDDGTPQPREGVAEAEVPTFNHSTICIVAFADGHVEAVPLTDPRLKGATDVGGPGLLGPLAN